MKISVLSEIVSIVCLICVTVAIVSLIREVEKVLTEKEFVEYQYKDWSNNDVEMAMKYHGADAITLTETEAFFYDEKKNKCSLFTDDCIEWIIKQKQNGERK